MAIDSGLSIPAALRVRAAVEPDTPAVIDASYQLTYGQLWDEAVHFARGLIERGIRPGDRVALWAPNSWRWVVAAYGVLATGAVMVPLNTRFVGREAAYALNRVNARALVMQRHFLGKDYASLLGVGDTGEIAELPHLRLIAILDEGEVDQCEPRGLLGWDELMANEGDAEGVISSMIDAIDPTRAISDILFTSGTTGYPKGVMTTHRANRLTNQAWAEAVGLRPGDRYLLVNPLFHSFGYRVGMLACLEFGATVYPVDTFDVSRVFDLIENQAITIFPGAPTVFSSLLADPDHERRDLSSLRVAVTGAAMVPVPLIRRMREDLGIATVLTAYGLTECCGTATICPPDADDARISTTSGIAIPGIEVIVADRDNHELPRGESGEILVRGFNVFAGYFDDEDATARVVDSQGWLHTGDIGQMDPDGYLTITDRLKDMFTTGGFNVYPAEVERVLLNHPVIVDAAVLGRPDERLGEVARAFVVLAPEASITIDEIEAHCRANLANYKVPRDVVVVDSLPRNPSGKIQKFKLRSGSPTEKEVS